MQVRAEELDALDVILLVQLLINGVRSVGGAAHWEEEDVLPRGLFEGQGHGDAVDVA